MIRGDERDNIRDGTDACDDIKTFQGQDISRAKDGGDTVDMGAGADGALGNKDGDNMFGNDGADFLGGGRGQDDLNDGAPTDTDFQCGNEGNDSLDTADGDNTDALIGGSGDDVLYDGADSDHKDEGRDPQCDDGAGGADTVISLGALPNLDGAPSQSQADSMSDPGYLFTDTLVGEVVTNADGSRKATIFFDWAWADEGFPGWRECVITLEDGLGATVVEEHRLFVGSAPAYDGDSATLDVPAVSGSPVDATISCFPGRVEDLSDTYQISDVRIHHDSKSVFLVAAPNRAALVSFDARWTGSGPGGVEVCFVRLFDRQGNRLAARSFDFMAASGASNDVPVPLIAAKPFRSAPRSVSVVCQ